MTTQLRNANQQKGMLLQLSRLYFAIALSRTPIISTYDCIQHVRTSKQEQLTINFNAIHIFTSVVVSYISSLTSPFFNRPFTEWSLIQF